MKTIALLFAVLCSSIFATAQTETKTTGVTITVTINNATNDNGKMLFGLHTKDTFMKADAIQKQQSKIVNGKTSITFTNITPGFYGILVVHDENNNKRMDFELNGMPKESYGASGNGMSFGPPQFMDAKFTVTDKDVNLEIRL